jgi:hypothetical protein
MTIVEYVMEYRLMNVPTGGQQDSADVCHHSQYRCKPGFIFLLSLTSYLHQVIKLLQLQPTIRPDPYYGHKNTARLCGSPSLTYSLALSTLLLLQVLIPNYLTSLFVFPMRQSLTLPHSLH